MQWVSTPKHSSERLTGLWRRCAVSGGLALIAVLGLIETSTAQVSTSDTKAGAKATAIVHGFTSLYVIRAGEGSTRTEVPALLADGDIICGIAFDKPSKVKSVDAGVDHPLTYDVRATSESSDSVSLIFSGELRILLLTDRNGAPSTFSCAAFFYPGVFWNVTSPIRKVVSTGGETNDIDLQPGKYEVLEDGVIEPLDKPKTILGMLSRFFTNLWH
jgi:hypothetical protein